MISIVSRKEKEFLGYDSVILSYSELAGIVDGDIRYEKWRDALSAVNGIHLICDTKYHKQYIGCTYGDRGILGRWTDYTKTHDGDDLGIREHLRMHPDAYLGFRFTILRVLQKPISNEEATRIESLFKEKLCAWNDKFGLNLN